MAASGGYEIPRSVQEPVFRTTGASGNSKSAFECDTSDEKQLFIAACSVDNKISTVPTVANQENKLTFP